MRNWKCKENVIIVVVIIIFTIDVIIIIIIILMTTTTTTTSSQAWSEELEMRRGVDAGESRDEMNVLLVLLSDDVMDWAPQIARMIDSVTTFAFFMGVFSEMIVTQEDAVLSLWCLWWVNLLGDTSLNLRIFLYFFLFD